MLKAKLYLSIYVPAVQALTQGNPNVVKAAKDSALLYAKMADAMHEAYQIPYEDIARIQMGGQPGDGYNMPVNRGVKADTLVNVVDLSPYVPNRIIDRNAMITYIRKLLSAMELDRAEDPEAIAYEIKKRNFGQKYKGIYCEKVGNYGRMWIKVVEKGARKNVYKRIFAYCRCEGTNDSSRQI